MAQNGPERALRRLVADLATARLSDIEAVLDALEPAPRARAQALLRAWAGEPGPGEEPAPSEAADEIDGLSPWLAQRLSRDLGPLALPMAGPDAFELTETAQSALRAAGADLPRRRPPIPAAPPQGWRGWFRERLRERRPWA